MPFAANYHTHTYRCKHASGDAPDYAREAVAAGLRVLGMSDHVPLPDGRWEEVRMAMVEIDEYEAAIATARRENPGLVILTGAECEYAPEYEAYYREELFGRRRFDYLIGASHFTEIDGRWKASFDGMVGAHRLGAYARQCVRTMESGLFSALAHPDIIGCSNPEWGDETAACARDICAAAAALGVPLELNSYGLRKPWIDCAAGRRATYPWDPFWAVAAEHGCTVLLSSDAHRPQDVAAGYDEIAALRDLYGLREVDPLADLVARRAAGC